LEATHWLPSPLAGGNRDVPHAVFLQRGMFWCSSENCLLPNQKTEAKIRCKILNHFTKRALPEYSAKKAIGNNAYPDSKKTSIFS
jgi:hypothetical protein